MYKTDFALEIMDRLPNDIASKAAAERIVNTGIDIIKEALAQGEKVSLTGFGVFERVDRAERKYHDFKTGEILTIKGTKAPRFRPFISLKETTKVKRGRPRKRY